MQNDQQQKRGTRVKTALFKSIIFKIINSRRGTIVKIVLFTSTIRNVQLLI